MDSLDLELLSAIADADQSGKPMSTWHLASLRSKTSLERNKLDGIYRYRLEQLYKKRLLQKRIIDKGKQKITVYTLRKKKFVCVESAVVILSNPITIVACPQQNKCKEKLNQRFAYTKCRLYAKSPSNIQKLIRDNLRKGKEVQEVVPALTSS